MTLRYCDSNAAGAGTGADWANAYTTLTLAMVGMVAGDTLYVAQDHNETTAAAITITSPGTVSTPCFIICANKAGTVPPVSADLRTTGVVSTTGASNITFGGPALGNTYCYGLTFSVGDAASTASPRYSPSANIHWTFDTCLFKVNNTSASSVVGFPNGAGGTVIWRNCTVQFGAVGQSFNAGGGTFHWNGGSVLAAGSAPTVLIHGNNINAFRLRGVDLSHLGVGKTLVSAPASADCKHFFEDCKTHASVTKATSPTRPVAEAIFTRCGATGINYDFAKYSYEGTETDETTIVRTGGATNGTTPIAKKIVTTANPEFFQPFIAMPIAVWNDTVGSITIDILGIWGGGAVPDNDDIWFELQYLDDANSGLATIEENAKADILATAAAHSTDASVWGGSTTAFKMTKTITPAQAGIIWVTIKAAIPSTTFYIDPMVQIS